MRILSLKEAQFVIAKQEEYSYTKCVIDYCYDNNKRVKDWCLLKSRTSHCGGTEWEWLGWLHYTTADALALNGVDDRR